MRVRLTYKLLRTPGSLPRLLFALLVGALTLLGPGPVQAQGPGQGLPYDEAEAQAIDRMLMCPVCPAETIDQSQAELARQMRDLVREMLAQGATRDEILDFFVARYGVNVLAAPPKSGANLLAWILPVAGVVAALLAVLAILRSMAAGGGRPATEPPSGDELEPYLEAVDRDLALLEAAGDAAAGTSREDGPKGEGGP